MILKLYTVVYPGAKGSFYFCVWRIVNFSCGYPEFIEFLSASRLHAASAAILFILN